MLEQIEPTEAPEELLLKFIKNGRIQVKQFPNLSVPVRQMWEYL